MKTAERFVEYWINFDLVISYYLRKIVKSSIKITIRDLKKQLIIANMSEVNEFFDSVVLIGTFFV